MKKITCTTLLLCLLSSAGLWADLPAPYNTVELLPYNPQGWYQNATSMEYLIQRSHAKVVVEVGCWLGLSTRHIAKTLPDSGIVYAVDHWKGSPNEDNSIFDIPNLYRQFLSNVIHEDLTHKIVPMRMSSAEAASVFPVKPDLIYLDATHDFDNVFFDLLLWFPFVKGHGVICGDDYFWGYDWPVKRAVDAFAKLHGLTVYNDGWLWYLEESFP